MRDGSDADFRRRAVECLDSLYAFAVSLCHDRAAAEDLVQETYLRALRALRHPAPDENLRAWLFTILHNVWRNEHRRRAPDSLESLPEVQRTLPSQELLPEEALARLEQQERVREAVAALPGAYREVVMLRFGEGFSYHQIATILDCPAGTVMSRLARARALLRRCVDAGGSA